MNKGSMVGNGCTPSPFYMNRGSIIANEIDKNC